VISSTLMTELYERLIPDYSDYRPRKKPDELA
jgi:hypothetical protein